MKKVKLPDGMWESTERFYNELKAYSESHITEKKNIWYFNLYQNFNSYDDIFREEIRNKYG